MLSRITGQVRTTLFAALWGVSIYGDIFFLAFKIPNLLRRFFAEGAMSSAFIPIFSKLDHSSELTKESTELSKEQFYRLIFFVMSGVMTIIVLLGIILAPYISQILFFLQEGETTKLAETTLLIRVLFPYIGLISLCALHQGVLENHGKFSLSASVPVIFNLFIIAATTLVIYLDNLRIGYENWFISSRFYEWWGYSAIAGAIAEGELRELAKTLLISGGVIVGGMAQLVYAGLGVRALGYRLGIFSSLFKIFTRKAQSKKLFSHPILRRFIYLLIPVFLATGSYQLQTLLLDPITFSLGEGAVSILYFANRILEFPLGIIGVAITTTSLPILARAAKNLPVLNNYPLDNSANTKNPGNKENSHNHAHRNSVHTEQSFMDIIESSLKGIWLLFIPIMLVSAFFPNTIIALVFKFSAFSEEDVVATAKCFLYLLPSLPILAGYRILFNGFYATENTKIPLKISLINIFFGLPLAYLLTRLYPSPDMIALSGTISAFLVFAVTIYLFKKKLGVSLYPFFKKNLILAMKILLGILPILYISHRLMNPFFTVLFKTAEVKESLWMTKIWQVLELSTFSVWVFFLYGVFLIILKEPQILKLLNRLKTKN